MPQSYRNQNTTIDPMNDIYDDDSSEIDLSTRNGESEKMQQQDEPEPEQQPQQSDNLLCLQQQDYFTGAQKFNRYDRNILENQISKKRNATANHTYNSIFLANDELPAYRSDLNFPASKELFEFVDDKEQLKELLSLELRRRDLYLHVKVVENAGKYMKAMFVVCNTCGRKLLMKYVIQRYEERFKLVHFDNTHIHDNDTQLILKKEFKYKIFLKELKIHRTKLTVEQFYFYLKREYNINQKDFRYFLSVMHEKRDQQMKALVDFLRKNDSRIWMVSKSVKEKVLLCQEIDMKKRMVKDPSFFMFSMPFMEANCINFSRICYINIVSGFIENKSKQEERSWQIITFTGLNNYNDLAIYAIAFLDTRKHSLLTISLIVRKFLKDFKASPEIIVTQYSQFYIDLIASLRQAQSQPYKGLHLFDAICYIETVGEKLQHVLDRIYYQQIILARTKGQFLKKCQSLFEKVQSTKKNIQVFNDLVSLAPRMCFSQIDTGKFLGLIFRYSGNKKMINLIRSIFTKGKITKAEENIQNVTGCIVRKKWKNNEPTLIKSIFLIVRAVIRYNATITSDSAKKAGYSLWRSEDYLDLPEIENIRVNVKKEFLDLILEQYGKIFFMEAAERELKDPFLKNMRTFDVFDKPLRSVFVVSAMPEYSQSQELSKFVWRCNCLYSFKCGLPCAHQIKVALITGTSIYDQMNEMWTKKREFPTLLKRRGRNKGTRRNTQK